MSPHCEPAARWQSGRAPSAGQGPDRESATLSQRPCGCDTLRLPAHSDTTTSALKPSPRPPSLPTGCAVLRNPPRAPTPPGPPREAPIPTGQLQVGFDPHPDLPRAGHHLRPGCSEEKPRPDLKVTFTGGTRVPTAPTVPKSTPLDSPKQQCVQTPQSCGHRQGTAASSLPTNCSQMASILPARSSGQNCSSPCKPHIASTDVALSQLPTYCFVQHMNRSPGRGGAVLLSDLPWTPMHGAQPRHGLWPGCPSSRPPARLEVTWDLPWSPSRLLPPPSHRITQHEAHGGIPEAQASPARGSHLCPSSGATQQPQAMWEPTPAHKPGSGLGTRLSWASPPREPSRRPALLTAAPQQPLLQASGCRLRLTKRFQCVRMQS